jgi:hypothetical protein
MKLGDEDRSILPIKHSLHAFHAYRVRGNVKKVLMTKETEILLAIFINPAAKGLCVAIKET